MKAELLFDGYLKPLVSSVMWRSVPSLRNHLLPLLFQDLGLEGTSLNDILYKNAAFLNLVDPISHELLLSLAREMQCPKKVS